MKKKKTVNNRWKPSGDNDDDAPAQSRVGALAKFEKLKIKVKVCSHVGGGGERFAITSVWLFHNLLGAVLGGV